jgi:hypothetical protein
MIEIFIINFPPVIPGNFFAEYTVKGSEYVVAIISVLVLINLSSLIITKYNYKCFLFNNLRGSSYKTINSRSQLHQRKLQSVFSFCTYREIWKTKVT